MKTNSTRQGVTAGVGGRVEGGISIASDVSLIVFRLISAQADRRHTCHKVQTEEKHTADLYSRPRAQGSYFFGGLGIPNSPKQMPSQTVF